MSPKARRYEVLKDDDRLRLKEGDILVGIPYPYDPGHRNNPDGKITILWREGDNYRPECSQYWHSLRRLRGQVPIELDHESNEWRRSDSRRRPLSRAKRNRHAKMARTA